MSDLYVGPNSFTFEQVVIERFNFSVAGPMYAYEMECAQFHEFRTSWTTAPIRYGRRVPGSGASAAVNELTTKEP